MQKLLLETTNPVMLTNIVYEAGETYQDSDWLAIVYKDMVTGKKHVLNIDNPTIEVGILKEEYRSSVTNNRCYIGKNRVDLVEVSYKNRNYEIGKLLGIDALDVRGSKFVFSSDIDIKTYYYILFKKLYGNDLDVNLSLGYIDIESDIMEFIGFAPLGEPPIYAVTFIDESDNHVYVFTYSYEKNKSSMEFLENKERFEKRVHEKFDEDFPEFTYSFLYFTEEIKMLVSLVKVIIACDNDYVGAWNMPYDIGSIIKRIEYLGYDPASVFHDEDFNHAKAFIEQDNNPIAHKRRHKLEITIKPTFVDMLVIYAGIRSAGKKLNLKLSEVCKKEINDDKLDYSETASIKTLPYKDFELAIVYNIKDVLLLVRLNQKTDDFAEMYMRMNVDCLMNNQIFVSTEMLTNSLRMYFDENHGLILGNNIHKVLKAGQPVKYVIANEESDTGYDEFDPYDDDDSDEDDKNKKQFSGAFVSETLRMEPTSVKLFGKLMKFIHDYLIDFDITSEYPTAIMIMNNSNDTLVGKVILTEEVDPIPMYSINLLPSNQSDEIDKYKVDPSEHLLELIAEDGIMEIGTLYCGLPTVEELMNIAKGAL